MKPPPETFYALTHPRICRDDHIRLAVDAVSDVGSHALVLGVLYLAAASAECFVSHDKLAAVGVVSRRTIVRTLARKGPLARGGWIKNLGRQPFSNRIKRRRRTVSVQLTKKAIEAFDGRFHALPRALLWIFHIRKDPLTWAECLVLAEVCSRWNLAELTGAAAVGREEVSIRELVRATGLSRRSVTRARQTLIARRALKPAEYADDGRLSMVLNEDVGLRESELPPTAVDVLRSDSGAPREWKPAPPRRARKPKAPPDSATTRRAFDDGARLSQQGCTVVTAGVSDCRSTGCQVVAAPGVNLSQTGCQNGTCNDLPLGPTSLTYSSDLPLGPRPVNETPTASVGGPGVLKDAHEKTDQEDEAKKAEHKLRARVAVLELRHWRSLPPRQQAAYHDMTLDEQLALLEDMEGTAREAEGRGVLPTSGGFDSGTACPARTFLGRK